MNGGLSSKFIYELDSGRSKLFNVERGTQEKINLSDCYVQQARWYVQDLRSWSANQNYLLKAAN